MSDTYDTPIGRRLPWYIIGNILLIPFGMFLFNPSRSALGLDDIDLNANAIESNLTENITAGIEGEENEEEGGRASLFYFLFFTSCVNIGQGAL